MIYTGSQSCLHLLVAQPPPPPQFSALVINLFYALPRFLYQSFIKLSIRCQPYSFEHVRICIPVPRLHSLTHKGTLILHTPSNIRHSRPCSASSGTEDNQPVGTTIPLEHRRIPGFRALLTRLRPSVIACRVSVCAN